MARYAAGLLVVDVEGVPGTDLRPLDVVEAISQPVSTTEPFKSKKGVASEDRDRITYLT